MKTVGNVLKVIKINKMLVYQLDDNYDKTQYFNII